MEDSNKHNNQDTTQSEDTETKVTEGNQHTAQFSSNVCCYSKELMSNVDRNDAKKSIIDTINSYDDDRFPSQGVNYSNMDENAQIEDSVATEILNKTLKYEEQELYRQLDIVTAHASRVENQTNTIIEQISEELKQEYSLPDVSHILEAHIEGVEQRWRTDQYEPSPNDSVTEENEATLVASPNNSALEDTLTEDNKKESQAVNCAVVIDANDSGICNESIDNEKVVHDNYDNGDKKPEDLKPNDNNTKAIEARLADISADDEIFEDCVEDINVGVEPVKAFDRVEENYTLEMKLALGKED